MTETETETETYTVGPRYMQQLRTEKSGSQTNSHIKRPRMTVNSGIRSRKMVNLQLQIHEIADKKTTMCVTTPRPKQKLYTEELVSVSVAKMNRKFGFGLGQSDI